MKKIIAYLLAFTSLLALAGCGKTAAGNTSAAASAAAASSQTGAASVEDQLSQELGMALSGATVSSSYTSDDGKITYYKLTFSDEKFVDEIQKSQEWFSTPLSDNLTALAYGLKQEDGNKVGPMLVNAEGKALIPEDVNDAGYYYFRNNDPEAVDPLDDEVIFDKDSLDVILAVYDVYDDLLFVTTLKQ
jgi:hypothetical protein